MTNTPNLDSLVKSQASRGVVMSFFNKALTIPEDAEIDSAPLSVTQRLKNLKWVVHLDCQETFETKLASSLTRDRKHRYRLLIRIGGSKSFFYNGKVFKVDKTKSPEELAEDVFTWVANACDMMSKEKLEMESLGYQFEPGGWFSREIVDGAKIKVRRAYFSVGENEPQFEGKIPWAEKISNFISGCPGTDMSQVSLVSAAACFEHFVSQTCQDWKLCPMSTVEYLAHMPKTIRENIILNNHQNLTVGTILPPARKAYNYNKL